MPLKRPDYMINRSDAKNICDVGTEGRRIISETDFASQSDFNPRRGVKVANILNDYFERRQFENKTILELGPGHYGFALLARHLGARVVCVERDSKFVQLGRYLGFEVIDLDFNELTVELLGEMYDGLWVKGTFNACNYRNDSEVEEFVVRLTSLTRESGWAWLTVVNKSARDGAEGAAFVKHRIEVQRDALLRSGWKASAISDEERPLYALKYSGSPYIYTRNIPAYPNDFIASSPTVNHGGEVEKSDADGVETFPSDQTSLTISNEERRRPYKKVQRVWKPTPEYYENPWEYYVDFINIAKSRGARFITMSDALAGKFDESEINILLDHHIDFYPVETEVMCRWELANDVVSNVYLFNRFIYNDTAQKNWLVEDINIPLYQELERNGFEIGYHQNAVGLVRTASTGRQYEKRITPADVQAAKTVFSEDIRNLRQYFDIRTFIPHGAGEGNAQLTELPDGVEGLTWVYNNAGRNGTVTPPLKWRNYSDSCGASAQKITGFRGQYVVNVDNLHLNAYLLEPGLNHVLVHPGRFGKGMPYELYDESYSAVDGTHVSYEFSGIDSELPVSVTELADRWLRDQGEGRRDTRPLEGEGRGAGKYYVITDNVSTLRDYMFENDHAIPVKVIHRRMTSEEKSRSRVPRPISTRFHTPAADEDFETAFAKFFNTLYTPCVCRHLAESGIPLDVVCLRELEFVGEKQLRNLARMLERVPVSAHVDICASVRNVAPAAAERILAASADEKLARRLLIEIDRVGSDEKSGKLLVKVRLPERVDMGCEIGGAEDVDSVIERLSDDELVRLDAVSMARREDRNAVIERFGVEEIRRAPRSFSKHIAALNVTPFESAHVTDEMACVRLKDGRVFYGYISKPNHQRAFEYVRDLVPGVLSPETFFLGLDVAQRYSTDFSWPPEKIVPPKGGTVVECGAYLGHKTIRFAEELVGREGKVLAIEMMPDNVEILRRNVRENGLEDVIDVIEAGVWSEAGRLPIKGKGRQRNSLLSIDKLNEDVGVWARVDTLDALLDEWGQSRVDLLFLTINGAEVEALQGMNRALERIRAIFVAAPYERDGRPSGDVCAEIARQKGCTVLCESTSSLLFITTPAF